MSDLSQIEREAKAVREFIAELKGLTPKFNATKERAEEELKLHLDRIETERKVLTELIDTAALIVQHLGAPVPCPTEAKLSAVMDEEVHEPANEVIPVVDSAHEDESTFDSVSALAAEITAAVEVIADAPPATPDTTDGPELTDEQVERIEDDLVLAPALELEAKGSFLNRSPFAFAR